MTPDVWTGANTKYAEMVSIMKLLEPNVELGEKEVCRIHQYYYHPFMEKPVKVLKGINYYDGTHWISIKVFDT